MACEIDCASSDNIFCLEDDEVIELPTYSPTDEDELSLEDEDDMMMSWI